MNLDVPPAWAALAGRLAETSWRRLIVLGGTDVGKSSFCRFLGATLARQHVVGLLDTDLGQKIVGPPVCVTLARCKADGDFTLARMRFVGETSPAANIAGVIAASARLAHDAAADRLIVNTSGLIRGPGIALKRWKLDALAPDHIVALARDDELAPILTMLPPDDVHRIGPSPSARRKRLSEREGNRRSSLLTALGECPPIALPLPIVEELRRTPPLPDSLRLCGLADRHGKDRGLGLVRCSDYAARHEVWTGLDEGGLYRLRLGMALAEFGDVPGPFRSVA